MHRSLQKQKHPKIFRINLCADGASLAHEETNFPDRLVINGEIDQEAFLRAFSGNVKKVSFFWLSFWIACVLTILEPSFLLSFLLLLPAKAMDNARKKTEFHFELDATISKPYQQLTEALLCMKQSNRIWLNGEATLHLSRQEKKKNAGASQSVARHSCSTPVLNKPGTVTGGFFMVSNQDSVSFGNRGMRFLFLPCGVIVKNGRNTAFVNYATIAPSVNTTRFIEEGWVPKDARVVGSTWKYVNIGGGPDKRYKDNREIPIMEYGELTLHVNGEEIEIMTSNAKVPQMVKEGILHYAASLAKSSPCENINSMGRAPDRMYRNICKNYALRGDLHDDKLERKVD